MKDKLAIVQNFVIKREERLETFNRVLPIQKKYFGDCNWYVNYNTSENLGKVRETLEENIENLHFNNDLTKDYGKIVQNMIKDVKEDYIFIYPADDCVIKGTVEYLNNLIDEFIHYECELMQMTRIDDVTCYGTDKKFFKNYDTRKFLHLVNSSKWTTQCVSSVSVFEKNFLDEILTFMDDNYYEKNARFHRRTPHSFESFFQRGNGNWSNKKMDELLRDRQFAIPKKGVLRHEEPTKNGSPIKENLS